MHTKATAHLEAVLLEVPATIEHALVLCLRMQITNQMLIWELADDMPGYSTRPTSNMLRFLCRIRTRVSSDKHGET